MRLFDVEVTKEELDAALDSEAVRRAATWRTLEADRYEASAIGRVYLLWAHSTNRFKIGFTRHAVEHRAAALNIGSPFPIKVIGSVAARHADEKELHWQLRAYRRNGEWFELTGSILKAVLYWFDRPNWPHDAELSEIIQ